MLIQAQDLELDENILHSYLSIALGGNSYLHPYIDNCYREREWEYYEAFQNSVLKRNALFTMYSTKSEEKIRQVAAILEWSIQVQRFAQIEKLIKKGYKFVYQYFHLNKRIDFEHFMRSYAKRKKTKVVKEIDLIYHNIVLWYLCKQYGKSFNKENVAWRSFQDVLLATFNEVEIQKVMFSKKSLAENKKEIERLYREYEISRHIRFDTIGTFLDYLISIRLKKIQEANPNISVEEAEKKVFEVSPTRYIGAIGGWLKTLQIHEMDALNQIPFSKMELDTVFLELLYAQKYHYITNDDQDLFLITCLYQKCLVSLYHETKQMYLEQSKREYYLGLKAKEARIKEQEAELSRKEREWKLKNQQLQREVDGLTEELRQKTYTIRQLEQQIENLEDYSEEVFALRTYAYKVERTEENEEENVPSLNTMIEFIKSMNIVVIGGSLNWQQKLKEWLPSVELFETDEITRDLSRIKRVDAVFINTAVLSHAFYKKVMKEMNKKGTPLFYLGGHSNMEKTLLEIYKWLTE